MSDMTGMRTDSGEGVAEERMNAILTRRGKVVVNADPVTVSGTGGAVHRSGMAEGDDREREHTGDGLARASYAGRAVIAKAARTTQ